MSRKNSSKAIIVRSVRAASPQPVRIPHYGFGSDLFEVRNLIFYGPPGTGKTFALQQLLIERYTEPIEDLSAEEWRALQIYERIRPLKWWEAIAAALYDIQRVTSAAQGAAKTPVKVSVLAEHPFIRAVAEAKGHTGNILHYLRRSLIQHSVKNMPSMPSQLSMATHYSPFVFNKIQRGEWYLEPQWEIQCAYLKDIVDFIHRGPSGTVASQHRYEFVTFHQSYGYEEFVEGLRPVVDEGEDKGGQVRYEVRPGLFLRLCERARRDPTHRYAMIIDEINRGNISKIFGELMTLLEPDKREGATQAVSVTLPYSGQPFMVPANVDVIGTMNTADRSLALLDIALRRRFEFIEKMPQPELLGGWTIKTHTSRIQVDHLLATLNKRIEMLYDREHTIGHAYLMPIRQLDESRQFEVLCAVFRNKILPLLQEYFFEDWQKIRLVLGDNQKHDPTIQFIQEFAQENDLISLFGRDHELNTYTARSRYQLNEQAFEDPYAYVGIYTPALANQALKKRSPEL